MPEARPFDERQGLRPFLVGLARKADDDVGAHHQLGHPAPALGEQRQEFPAAAAARHAPQHAVGTRLHGQVQMRHQARVVEQRPEMRRQVPGLERTQAQARDAGALQHLRDQFVQRAAGIAAVAAQVHPGQHRLVDPVRMQGVDLVDDLGDRAAALLAARQGHHAIGAAVAAAVLHLDEGALASAREQRGFARLGRGLRHQRQLQFAPGYLHQAVLLVVAHDQVHAQLGRGLFRGQRGITAAHDQARLRILAVRPADQVARLAHRLLGDRTGVDHHQVGLGDIPRELDALRAEVACPGLEFGFVEATAQCLQVNAHGCGSLGKEGQGAGAGPVPEKFERYCNVHAA